MSVAISDDTPTPSASGKNSSNENFPVAAIVRAELRPHVHAFYNFARAADDISDDALMEPQEKILCLNEFAATLSGKSNAVAVCVAMRESLQATSITPQHCLDLLTAFKRDATQLRYADWDDLLDYCRYSASPVGRYVLALHGIGEEAWPANDALCTILQIINHIQDCYDDYRELDRVYIPQDMLMACGGVTADLSHEKSTEGLHKTLQEMLDKTTAMMPTARDLPRKVPDMRLKCETSIIYALAEKMIEVLRRRDPLSDMTKLNKLQKVGAVISGLARAWM